MLAHEVLGMEVGDLELGELRPQAFPQVAAGPLGQAAEVAQRPAGLSGDPGQLIRPEDDYGDHREHQELGDGQVEQRFS